MNKTLNFAQKVGLPPPIRNDLVSMWYDPVTTMNEAEASGSGARRRSGGGGGGVGAGSDVGDDDDLDLDGRWNAVEGSAETGVYEDVEAVRLTRINGGWDRDRGRFSRGEDPSSAQQHTRTTASDPSSITIGESAPRNVAASYNNFTHSTNPNLNHQMPNSAMEGSYAPSSVLSGAKSVLSLGDESIADQDLFFSPMNDENDMDGDGDERATPTPWGEAYGPEDDEVTSYGTVGNVVGAQDLHHRGGHERRA